MSKLKLTIQTGQYEIVRAIRDGSVRPEGIDLEFPEFPGTRGLHMRMAEGAYDVGEFNAGAYMADRSRGGPMTALPAYLHRRFRHGFVFVNTAKGIESPRDLIGKRIGGTNFGPAGVIWARGILENHHGVPHRSITWVTERDEDGHFDYHPDLKIERIAPGQDLDQMLRAGELDAMISPDIPASIREGDPRVARLWPDYKQREVAWFRETGLFPIMHVTVIREAIVREHPWVVGSLMDAFEKAKQIAMQRLVNPRIVPLAWYMTAWEEERALLGPDPWAFGLGETNRRNLEMLAMFVQQQGLTDRRMTLDELLPVEAFDWRPAPSQAEA